MKKINILIIALIVIAGSAALYLSFRNAQNTKTSQDLALITPVTEPQTTITSTESTPSQIMSPTAVPSSDSKTFANIEAGIILRYPSAWTVHENGQSFQEGDLLSLIVRGETQRPQSELHDGIIFAVMKPIVFSGDVKTWVKDRYDKDVIDPSRPPQHSQVTFGGKTYEKVITCGLGCFTYFHTVQNGKIYGYGYMAAGPNETSYDSKVIEIMNTVQYTK